MFKGILKWFVEEPKYKLGALLNPADPRDIPVSSFQDKISRLPSKHITDISILPVLNQRQNGSCVGHAIATAIAYYDYLETGKLTKPSPRFIYGMAKRFDNLVSEGTYPRIGGAIALGHGCATEKTLENNNFLSHSNYITFDLSKEIVKDAKPRKIGGYAFVNPNASDIKNAIINNDVVLASVAVDWSGWRTSPVQAGVDGYHYIMIYGFDGDRFYFRNSWGSSWNDNGNGYFNLSDYRGSIYDIMVITDIPNEIVEEYKGAWPYENFTPKEFENLKDELRDKLQKARTKAGVPFRLNSGFRTASQNTRAGGKDNSAHLTGEAVDIAYRNSRERYKIKKALYDVGFLRIGDDPKRGFIHADISKTLPQEVEWDY